MSANSDYGEYPQPYGGGAAYYHPQDFFNNYNPPPHFDNMYPSAESQYLYTQNWQPRPAYNPTRVKGRSQGNYRGRGRNKSNRNWVPSQDFRSHYSNMPDFCVPNEHVYTPESDGTDLTLQNGGRTCDERNSNVVQSGSLDYNSENLGAAGGSGAQPKSRKNQNQNYGYKRQVKDKRRGGGRYSERDSGENGLSDKYEVERNQKQDYGQRRPMKDKRRAGRYSEQVPGEDGAPEERFEDEGDLRQGYGHRRQVRDKRRGGGGLPFDSGETRAPEEEYEVDISQKQNYGAMRPLKDKRRGGRYSARDTGEDGVPERNSEPERLSSWGNSKRGWGSNNGSKREFNRGRKAVSGGRKRNENRENESAENDETQRGRLIEDLSSNSYECMVCCEMVRKEAAIWSCSVCYHIFHLRCIRKWARSTNAAVSEGETQGGWRCPSCQNVSHQFPNQYRCFCGKVRDPEWNHFETPHSCGGLCNKPGPQHCSHPCTLVCHPGPCPPCHASVVKDCQCGKTKQTVRCGQAPTLQCTKPCEKALNCGKHQCTQICHAGNCEPCDVIIHQDCYCGKENRDVICGSKESFSKSYSCEAICNRVLKCGNHRCEQSCHPGECQPCSLLPESVTTCPCGKAPLSELQDPDHPRESCLDTVPTCDAICDKPLKCGPKDAAHTCAMVCHSGPCGGCKRTTIVNCRCGAQTESLPCSEAMEFSEEHPYTCTRKCNKKLSCGRHKCLNKCCVDTEHKCTQTCRRRLTCQLHQCEEPCHTGNCPTCWHVSFDDLTCECGLEVICAPIPCGTKPPECRQPCTRTHACDHPVLHNCHSDENCPPCTTLTEKWCHGKHELRSNLPCYITEVTCGRPCGKDLPCGQHQCIKTCHKGPCMSEGEICTQPCKVSRDVCGHPCLAPCHVGTPCPDKPCQTTVECRCECGNRVEKVPCGLRCITDSAKGENYGREFPSLTTSMLAMKIADAQDGQSFDITSLTRRQNAPAVELSLECNSECGIIQRNRRLALALQIKNPDLSSKLTHTPYTPFLKDFCKTNARLVSTIEAALKSLVEKTQEGKQAHRSHAFAPMKSIQRKVVHELAEYYGCETQSYDEEPNTNVVATATRGRCWLPNLSLTALMQRELHGKAPMPIPLGVPSSQIRSAALAANQSTKLIGPTKMHPPSKPAWGGASSSTAPKREEPKPKEPAIDYFDMTD